jgi:hypothetical protein
MANKKHEKKTKYTKKGPRSRYIKNLVLSRYEKTVEKNNEDHTDNIEENINNPTTR